jgi:predicted kinase
MLSTVEDSTWHREENVAVHTEMSITKYLESYSTIHTAQQQKLCLLALLYHDVGKPAAEELKTKEDGTTYRRYSGHEQDSAVAFMQDYVRVPELRTLLNLQEARAVRWIIENHLPYGYTREEKRGGLAVALRGALSTAGVVDETFYACLRSDAAGRISDDHEVKLANVESWIAEFDLLPKEPRTSFKTNRNMYILVGPSGSGKTTWRTRMSTLTNGIFGIRIMSVDDLRVAYFNLVHAELQLDEAERYRQAWDFTCADKEFTKWADAAIDRQYKLAEQHHCSVIVDMTNGGRKKRVQWTDRAKKEKLNVIIVEFWSTFETLIKRQKTRGDKAVPASAVHSQLYATNTAWQGYECDTVILEIGA